MEKHDEAWQSMADKKLGVSEALWLHIGIHQSERLTVPRVAVERQTIEEV